MARLISVKVGAPAFRVQHLTGAWVNYDTHPTITDSTNQADFTGFDDRLETSIGRTGPILAGPHGYSGTSWPATFASSAVSFATSTGYPWSWLNVKTGSSYTTWQGVVDGDWDAYCTTYVNSVPSDHNHVIILNHEPENDGTQPSSDGGTWENQYGPIWSQGQARIANLIANLNKPNVYFAVCLMTDTFPANGTVGSLGLNNRNPQNWDCWQYMNSAAKARTVFAPDGYTEVDATSVTAVSGSTTTFFRCTDTDLTADSPDFAVGHAAVLLSSTGQLVQGDLLQVTAVSANLSGFRQITVSPSFESAPTTGMVLRRIEKMSEVFNGSYNYVQNDSWGVQWLGITEHTINNDIGVDSPAMSVVWRDDVKPYLRGYRDASSGPHLGYYLLFNASTGLASGVNGWVDGAEELSEFGQLAWELSTGEVL